MRARPEWVDTQLFPFESKWITIGNNDIHYVDEGTGDVILFAHGTPEWSFGYRDLIKLLSKNYRCIAMDMLGFGLSDKPVDADYSCPAHANRLKQFIASLQLTNIVLVANDFGGSIGMSYAIDHPENIKAIVLFNTWIWSLKDDRHYATPAKIMNTWLGKWLYLKKNFPVNIVMPAAYGNKSLLTKEIHAHYKNALPPGNRHAAYQFSKELISSSEWFEELWRKLPRLAHQPTLLIWGARDKFVPIKELDKLKMKLPNAKTLVFNDAGHFVQEEKPAQMTEAIINLIGT